MDINELLALIGALGGIKAIEWVVNFFVNRKTNARKEDASADAAEIQNLLNVISNLSGQLDKSDVRMTSRDGKVDFLYSENNKLKAEKLELIKKNYELELRLKEAEIKKCDVRGCSNRQPPSDY
ncbi:hypothetical protein [Bacteroides oleiciplenus]|uniref:hypothetical protein n=2 Tax=Bacteroides TaxID=816 RepID=UPI0026DB8478|nr:hypothetical protein [Bacteroides oleiciplenus]